ncbi:hypothetical protein CLV78_11012 [Aliiruegeria haliotis]|uniref:MOSC domain-containing protein n=1 Tax=Aliiruegeria haliotis TaxID=1280846 RepID=A0A2T0RJ04_9RHOB|nr:MOSC domain-containing protein [Aliiruegeria haliotis]PRY21139.1 hypothetical protein CLV78_11012 [Aliiruegeria haliotis]
MTGRLAHIVRHPIKSIGWEPLPAATLAAGCVLPGDRRWAVAHDAAAFDGQPDGWHAKRNFVRGVAAPQLMAVRATTSENSDTVTLTHPNAPVLDIEPDTEQGSHALVAWLAPLWPDTRPAASRIVKTTAQAMTDVPDPFVSILNLSSLRALGQRLNQDLSIHRFRGNLWLDGFAPWEEFDWIGRSIRIGDAVLRIDERITRCNATKYNPETGREDLDTLGALEAGYGHRDFGVYATVVDGGPIRIGDRAEPE